MSFSADLLETAPNRPGVSKYTSMNGLVYLGAGALLMVWPGAVQTLLFDEPFAGHEGGLSCNWHGGWRYWLGSTSSAAVPEADNSLPVQCSTAGFSFL